ncbi:hypothetical protein MACJ_002999 [Theileria orientalis]|uniref:Cytochrome c oxidase assembly protein n=1 Tax=Theileria orientalis TaxID=68886 RepID=A0A976QVU4_THEOR|nr:hypothetical protein MACJ_002999 [Theileria orientalis]
MEMYTTIKSTKDLVTPTPAESEIVQSNNFHNIDDEIRNKDILDTGNTNEITFNRNKGGCDVLRDDFIEVAVDPHDILKTQTFVYSITPAELRLYFKDRNSKNSTVPKKGKLFARFSFNAIVTPFETISSSRECLRMFYKNAPIIFCGSDTKSRDSFMVSLIKAKFCHVANTALSPAHKTSERGKTAEKLPLYSTKIKRLKNILSGKEDVGINPHENKITNIDIKNLISGRPQRRFQMMFLRPRSDKPHRFASNSCDKLQTDMVECYKASRCFKELNRSFDECLDNLRVDEVGAECVQLKKSLAQCRRNLLNGKFRTTGNPYSG